jgi:putative SOS response-associated peptidase YedK
MPVLLDPSQFEAWLHATDEAAQALLHSACQVPLVGAPAPRALAPHPAQPPQAPRRPPPAPAADPTLSLF